MLPLAILTNLLFHTDPMFEQIKGALFSSYVRNVSPRGVMTFLEPEYDQEIGEFYLQKL